MEPMIPPGLIRVKRDGGRGHRLIDRAKFEAGGFELYDAEPQPEPVDDAEPAKRRGRPPKAR